MAWRCGAGETRLGAPVDRPSALARLDLADQPAGDDCSWASDRWAAEAELLLGAQGRPAGSFTVRLGARHRAVLELVAPDNSHVPAFRPVREVLSPQDVAALPVLPEAAARVLPDLELLRAGLITPDQLHPLVAAGLVVAGSGPAADSGSQAADPHRVECRGEIHRIGLRDGVLAAIDHDPAQLHREELLVALGGPALPCLRAIDAVHRDPEALPAVRERIGHGDISGALKVVEELLGPGAILRDGQLRQELESAACRRIAHGLFRSGLHSTAGPDRNASDSKHVAGFDRRRRAELRPKRGSRARRRTSLS